MKLSFLAKHAERLKMPLTKIVPYSAAVVRSKALTLLAIHTKSFQKIQYQFAPVRMVNGSACAVSLTPCNLRTYDKACNKTSRISREHVTSERLGQRLLHTTICFRKEAGGDKPATTYGDEVVPVAKIIDSKDKTDANRAKTSAKTDLDSEASQSSSTAATENASNELVIERLSGSDAGIIVIGLNRPSRKNAIGANLIEKIELILAELKIDKSVRVLIIRSHVDGIFCAGADLKERLAMKENDVGPYVQRQRQAVRALFGLPFPTIAAVDGGAFGGGFEIALAADIRVASEISQMGLLETRLAIIPGAGGTQYLRRLVNPSIAKELMFTARVIKAKEAHRLGIVNFVVEKNAYDKALEVAQQILRNGPIAVRSVKMAVDKGTDAPNIDDALQVEEYCYDNVIGTKDRIEGLTAFVEKRTPKFIGA